VYIPPTPAVPLAHTAPTNTTIQPNATSTPPASSVSSNFLNRMLNYLRKLFIHN
jgi:hypothetical protein